MKRRIGTVMVFVFLIVLCGCKTADRVVEVTATPVVETKTATIAPTSTKTIPTPTPTKFPTPTPTQTRTKVPTLANTPTMVPTATKTLVPTKTTIYRMWTVEMQVKGLPSEELACLSFKFSNGSGKELVLVSRKGNLFTFLEEPVWVNVIGSQDGCPWSDYWLRGGQNPKKIQTNIYTGQLVVVFDFGKK